MAGNGLEVGNIQSGRLVLQALLQTRAKPLTVARTGCMLPTWFDVDIKQSCCFAVVASLGDPSSHLGTSVQIWAAPCGALNVSYAARSNCNCALCCAVCYSVLCSVLQCAVQFVTVCCAVCYSVLCSVLRIVIQCAAVCCVVCYSVMCSMLQCAVWSEQCV